MKKIINRLLQFFQDDTGALSSMRLLFIVWGLGVFAIWAFLSIKHGILEKMDVTIMGFLISLTGGKVLQSMTDNSTITPVLAVPPATVAAPVSPPILPITSPVIPASLLPPTPATNP